MRHCCDAIYLTLVVKWLKQPPVLLSKIFFVAAFFKSAKKGLAAKREFYVICVT